MSASQHAGFTATVLGLDVPLDPKAIKSARDLKKSRGHPTVLLRIMLVGFILCCYYHGQNWAIRWHDSHGYTETKIDYADDIGHQFF